MSSRSSYSYNFKKKPSSLDQDLSFAVIKMLTLKTEFYLMTILLCKAT